MCYHGQFWHRISQYAAVATENKKLPLWQLSVFRFPTLTGSWIPYAFYVQLYYGQTVRFSGVHAVSDSLWRHQMKAFFALLALCEGNPPVTGRFPSQRASNAGFIVKFWTDRVTSADAALAQLPFHFGTNDKPRWLCDELAWCRLSALLT